MFENNKENIKIKKYLLDGKKKALLLKNRGPIKFDKNGNLDSDILKSYKKYGFYVFENVLTNDELKDIERDVFLFKERLPKDKKSKLDIKGRPALGVGGIAPTLFWSKPLGDPFGGTEIGNGRHPVKMQEPIPEKGSPEEVVFLILGSLQFSDAFLRLTGHPKLLKIAENINGEDFVPFTEALFFKEPGLGASVAWHQDGTTHWNTDEWDESCHGFNFMAQLYGSTPANGVWVVPGTHKLGKLDIKDIISKAGTERLPDAVPLVCGPGDIAITNRQILHCSFANTSDDLRVTLNFGFHKRKSVLNVNGGGFHSAPAVYDDDHIRERSKMIAYAIDARKQKFKNETSYIYKPFKNEKENFKWTKKVKDKLLDYNLLDISI